MRGSRLAGHTLPRAGRIIIEGQFASVGSTRCSCGVKSPVLDSDAARKRWHRDHKNEVRQQQTKETL